MNERLMVEILPNTTNFAEIKKLSELLEKQGLEPVLVPKKKSAELSHLLVETEDLSKVKKILKGKKFKTQKILFSKLENKP